MGTGDSFSFSGCISGGEWGSQLLSSVKFRNKWVYTSTPPHAFIAYKDMSFAYKLLENYHWAFGLTSTVRCLKVQKWTQRLRKRIFLCVKVRGGTNLTLLIRATLNLWTLFNGACLSSSPLLHIFRREPQLIQCPKRHVFYSLSFWNS